MRARMTTLGVPPAPGSSPSVWDDTVYALASLLEELTLEMQKTEARVVGEGSEATVLQKLSLQAYRSLRLACELLTSWGIVPYLPPGVGIPAQLRPVPLQQIRNLRGSIDVAGSSFGTALRAARAVVALTREPELQAVVVDSLLPDLIASLLLFAYSPNIATSQPSTAPTPVEPDPSPPPAPTTAETPGLNYIHSSDRHWCEKTLQALVSSAPRDALGPVQLPAVAVGRSVMYLLSLSQSAASKAAATDLVWLRQQCAAILTSILADESGGGVHSILAVLLDTAHIDEGVYIKTAQLVASIPRAVRPEKYISVIASQLVEELFVRGVHGERHTRAAVAVTDALLSRSPLLAWKHIFLPLLRPFYPYLLLFKANLARVAAEDRPTPAEASEPSAGLLTAISTSKSTKSPSTIDSNDIAIRPASAPAPAKSAGPAQARPPPQKFELKSGWKEAWAFYEEFGAWDFARRVEESTTFLSAAHLTHSLQSLLIFATNLPHPLFFPLLTPVIPGLFELLVLSRANPPPSSSTSSRSVSKSPRADLASAASEILRRYFASVDGATAQRMLLHLISHNDKNWTYLPRYGGHYNIAPIDGAVPGWEFVADPTGAEVSQIVRPWTDVEEVTRDIFVETEVICELIKAIHMEEERTRRKKSAEERVDIWEASVVGDVFVGLLHQIATPSSTKQGHSEMVGVQVLLMFCQDLGESVLRNVLQVALFAKSILNVPMEAQPAKSGKISTTEASEGPEESPGEFVGLALGLLDIIVARDMNEAEAGVILVDLIGPIRRWTFHADATISGPAKATLQRVLEGIAKCQTPSTAAASASGPQESKLFNPGAKQKTPAPHASGIDEALADIGSPLVPIRAGGLIQLRRFLLLQTPEAIAALPKILETFATHLNNEDSYVYLGAIEGLGAVGDIALSQALPMLTKEYLNERRTVEGRLKVGEVLVHVARRLALFKQAGDATLKASALSNVAELCEVLGFGLIPYVSEILELILQLLVLEKEVEVRRAAVNTIFQLFVGLDEKIFQVIPDFLKRLLQTLRRVKESSTEDEVVRYLAVVTLAQLEAILKEQFQPTASGNAAFDSVMIK